MPSLRAAYGIASAELTGQLRSGVLIGNIVISILFILLLGTVLGLSGAPRRVGSLSVTKSGRAGSGLGWLAARREAGERARRRPFDDAGGNQPGRLQG